jgi:hypothetical protein
VLLALRPAPRSDLVAPLVLSAQTPADIVMLGLQIGKRPSGEHAVLSEPGAVAAGERAAALFGPSVPAR